MESQPRRAGAAVGEHVARGVVGEGSRRRARRRRREAVGIRGDAGCREIAIPGVGETVAVVVVGRPNARSWP